MGAIEVVEKTQMTERPQMQAGDTVARLFMTDVMRNARAN